LGNLFRFVSLGYSGPIRETSPVPRKFFRQYTPDASTFRKYKQLHFLGERLHSEDLWHLNRNSVARGFATGLFWCVAPIPLQMVAAAITALIWRANMPISIILVWISNPLTMVPLYYSLYRVGAWLLDKPAISRPEQVSFAWLWQSFANIGAPLLLGTTLVGTLLALLGYFGIHLVWRLHVVTRWQQRKKR